MAKWVREAIKCMNSMYPLQLAEGWDNVGVLIDTMDDEAQAGDGPAVAFITNDLTEKTLEEAMSKKAKLIITYHPRPFGSMKKLGRGDITQRIVLRCARAGIVVYSPHTACDNAAGGVNDWLADSLLSLAPSSKTEVIEPSTKVEGTGFEGAMAAKCGSGRMVTLGSAVSLPAVVQRVKEITGLAHVRLGLTETATAGPESVSNVLKIAVQAGSGLGVLKGCTADVWVTGEMGHHDVLAVCGGPTSVILTEHSNSERGYLPTMAAQLADKLKANGFTDVAVVVSTTDADPLCIV